MAESLEKHYRCAGRLESGAEMSSKDIRSESPFDFSVYYRWLLILCLAWFHIPLVLEFKWEYSSCLVCSSVIALIDSSEYFQALGCLLVHWSCRDLRLTSALGLPQRSPYSSSCCPSGWTVMQFAVAPGFAGTIAHIERVSSGSRFLCWPLEHWRPPCQQHLLDWCSQISARLQLHLCFALLVIHFQHPPSWLISASDPAAVRLL